MAECGRLYHVAALFDGEAALAPPDTAEHAATCPDCARYLAHLRMLRDGVGAVAETGVVTDGQFGAFLDGIRECIDAPVRGWRRFWTLASMAAAAVLIALALYAVFADFSDPARQVEATIVEAPYSELSGVSIDVQIGKDGNAVIWVNNAPNDVWYGTP